MNQVVRLKLDTAYQSQIRVTFSVKKQGQTTKEKMGWLPTDDALTLSYNSWQQSYRGQLDSHRIKGVKPIRAQSAKSEKKKKELAQKWLQECRDKQRLLKQHLNNWLKDPSFQPIREAWLAQLSPSEPVRLILETNTSQLRRLPWHL